MTSLETFDLNQWKAQLTSEEQNRALTALENGKVLYFPSLAFSLDEDQRPFLSASILQGKSKNVSYTQKNDLLKGCVHQGKKADQIKNMVRSYSLSSCEFLKQLLPFYAPHLILGKTSFRPAKIEKRTTSYRKDDTLLHVDAFPSNPLQGQRILRVFTNVNPEGKPRVWRLGEPLESVLKRFLPQASAPFFGVSTILKAFGITKGLRTPYDHYMLQIHDLMKGDKTYQQKVAYEEILFPAGSSWITYTDQTSHAAMAGQHVLEQTFYLSPDNQKSPKTAPLKVLERLLNRKLT